MKILLFDNKTTGHHLSYATFFIKYLKEKRQKVTFITILEQHTKLLNRELGKWVKYLPNKKTNQKNKVLRFIQDFIKDYQDLNQVLRYALCHQFNILHLLCIDQSELASFLALFLHKKSARRIAIVASLHKEYTRFPNNSLANFLKNRYVRLVVCCLHYLLKKDYLKYLTVHTETTRKAMIKFLAEKGDLPIQKKVKLMPYPTRILSGIITQEEAREYLGLPQKIPLLLFFGGMRTNKGIFTLLKSLKHIKGDFRLLLAGGTDRARQKEIKKFINDNHISQKTIIRFDYISAKEADYYFIAADIVLLPYHEHKSQSGPLLQACAAAKPIIGSDAGFIGYALKKYSLGQVVKAKSVDALRKAIQNFLKKSKSPLTHSFNKNGLSYAKKNYWRKTGQTAFVLYQNALKEIYNK